MPFDLDISKKQIIALMGLAVRDETTGIPTYSTSMGDSSYADDEIDRANQSSATLVMQALCETDGQAERGAFVVPTSLTNEGIIPRHYGSIGVPRITPFSGAGYTIVGKRKSIEDISAYRRNPNEMYSTTAHNASSNGTHSKLAGFYAIENNTFYFTGYSAVSDIATFTESSYTLLPDNRYQLVVDLAIAKLKKDGDISDIFDYYNSQGFSEILWIRQNKMYQPSKNKTLGFKDAGDK